ncbi:hypothetical protein HYPSUDRAFT_143241 [Hypholoma sublateritium FD-334 SS-4]|uniref:Uncharacterized protein n=1 Tax=Hypholoma sublateritium (strain FD-334 SS-4) TaxID=945553 RepID=A0A0D2NLQ0_HYPSF|nr:hypothetical protein HYPSUDRAFT_143241 [Hypholoma sublateritium FD-334 SS-4]
MPSFTTLFEDTSPILTYSSNWGAGTSETDPLADQYSASSFTLTQTQGSTMNLAFNGTGVSLIGAMRGNHGLYAVNIDGTQSASMNGSSSSNLFNQTLFENNSLQMGAHTLILSNLQGTFVDIDYVTITTQVGNNTEDLIVNTFQNTHPSFLYSPESDWYTPSTVSSFSGASGHATQSASALVRMSFQVSWDGIAVYGPVGHNQTSSYVVQIDDGQLSTFNAQQSFYRAQQIMFFASNLGGGPHTLTMRLGSAGGELAIDYVDVYTAPSLGGRFACFP